MNLLEKKTRMYRRKRRSFFPLVQGCSSMKTKNMDNKREKGEQNDIMLTDVCSLTSSLYRSQSLIFFLKTETLYFVDFLDIYCLTDQW